MHYPEIMLCLLEEGEDRDGDQLACRIGITEMAHCDQTALA